MIRSDADLACMYPDSQHIQPASIDLHLGDEIRELRQGVILDPEVDQADEWERLPLGPNGRWLLQHMRPYLGVTQEPLTVDSDHVGILHGVSSIGRLFLLIHVTAGLVDPGWKKSRLTLELFPLGGSIWVRPGMRIGQITLHQLSSSCLSPYSGKYNGDQGAVPSRMFREAQS